MVARAVWLHFSGSFQRVIAIHDSMNSVVNDHEPTACGSELGYEYQQIRRTVTCLGQRKKMSFCYLSTMNAVSTNSGNLESTNNQVYRPATLSLAMKLGIQIK